LTLRSNDKCCSAGQIRISFSSDPRGQLAMDQARLVLEMHVQYMPGYVESGGRRRLAAEVIEDD